MKKEEAEKLKKDYREKGFCQCVKCLELHDAMVDATIDAMVDPKPYVPQLWDWVTVPDNGTEVYPFNRQNYQIIGFDGSAQPIIVTDLGEKYGIYTSRIRFLRHGTAPEMDRPPQKVTKFPFTFCQGEGKA